ncbi:MAG: hypothetical protein QOJ07_3483 [Thermoleophilaceae bacterium]|jgi:limonene-1,2-epoxide hydrolase|nr:hypothetical protein [Thermoleophilaceae bacterium]
MKRRALLLLAPVLAALAMGGCGTGNDEAAARDAVESYLAAFARGDGTTACDQLTDTARAYVTGMAATVGASDCEGAFARVRKLGGRDMTTIARDTKIRNIAVNGKTARVSLRSHGESSVAELEKVGEAWKIASLPKS